MYCYKCGKPLPQEANFCPVCGAAVSVPEETKAGMQKESIENAASKLLKKPTETEGFTKASSSMGNRYNLVYNVKITQKRQVGMNHPKIKLIINYQYEKLVTQETSCALQLEPGVNIIQFTYWIRTTIIEFDLDYDTSFEAKFNRMTGYIDITSPHPFNVIFRK